MTHRILVVEDDPVIQECCVAVLAGGGFAVEACSFAAEARKLFESFKPDLLVLDYGLPDGNGLDLMRVWRKAGSKVPVLFLTARGDLKTRLECFRSGAQDYLVKPFAIEELLARANVHLRVKETQDELAKRNVELELVGRARQDMADMIVHDLKAPLTSIKCTLSLIESQGLISHKNYETLLKHAGSAADFMLLMLNDLLDVGRDAQSVLRPEPAPFAVPELFDKLAGLFSGRSQSLGVKVAFRTAPGAEKMTSDHNFLYRVLVNLISNAMKASSDGKGKTVEVECARDGAKTRFSVLDRGYGVPDADKQKIFEKYAAGSKGASPLESGTGLGLAFCRAAAKALKGRVWVEDRPGGGSVFHLEILTHLDA